MQVSTFNLVIHYHYIAKTCGMLLPWQCSFHFAFSSVKAVHHEGKK